MSPRFAHRTVLVTGASRGIGLAVAHRAAAEGARVVITGRDKDTLAAAAAEIGPAAVPVAGKVDAPEHHAHLAEVLRDLGGLDHLVSNVGINPVHGPLTDLDLGAARKILEANVLGAFQMARLAVEAGIRERTGSVVFVSSVAGVTASPGIGMYGVSKSAVAGLARQLAAELAPEVRVNAVAPAAVKTAFARALFEGREPELAAQYPLGRLGEVDDVAGPILFLLSDDAAWITGQTLTIDGGAMLRTPE